MKTTIFQSGEVIFSKIEAQQGISPEGFPNEINALTLEVGDVEILAFTEKNTQTSEETGKGIFIGKMLESGPSHGIFINSDILVFQAPDGSKFTLTGNGLTKV